MQNVGLSSAWKLGRILVEQDLDLHSFHPANIFKAMEVDLSIDLLNPFGSNVLDDADEDETLDPAHAPDSTIPSQLPSTDLEVLVDNEYAKLHGVKNAIEVDRKLVHKAKILHEFFKYSRLPNLTDQLKQVANLSHFAIMSHHQDRHIGDESIIKAELLLVKDPVAALVICDDHVFLAIGQVNAIKVDG